jgi:general secretion pathway protein F
MNMNSARFMQTLSILAGSGVPILEALKISANVVTSLPMKQAVNETTIRVSEGESISKSLSQSHLFPPMMIHMIGSGENSGRLEEMLDRATVNQEQEVENTIATLLGIMQPLTVIIMAGIVLLIVLAILLPIFEINNLIA